MKLPTLNRADDDDLFAHTRMSFGDHIEELRTRMIRAILGFLVALGVGLFVGQPVMEFIQAPVRSQLVKFYEARVDKKKEQLKEERKQHAANGEDVPFDAGAAKEWIVQTREPMRDWQVDLKEGEGGDEAAWTKATLRLDFSYFDGDDRKAEQEAPGQMRTGPDGDWTPITLKAKPSELLVTEGDPRKVDVKLRRGKDGEWKPVTLRINPADVASLTAWRTVDMRINPAEVALAIQKDEWEITPPASLTALTITESFMTYLMVSIYCGIVLASPWIFWQLWQFIGAGLYPHEKRYVHLYLPLSIGLFLGGCALAWFVVLKIGIAYLLSFSEWLGVEPELRLSEWVNFAVMVPVVFGVAFQTPLVMLFLERVGIVKVDFYTKNRKMAIFVLAIVAALLAVAPDAFSMMSLAVPMWGLYELGILLCKFAPRPPQIMEEPDPEEMVEV